MATTTNYGWVTPDDTSLVKDGASAIRTLGTSVDTTTKNLNPETTLGDISFCSSTSNVNTRLGIGGTGTVLTVASGVPSWATPAAGGGMTLISTTTLTGASVTLSSIPGTYNNLQLVFRNARPANDAVDLAIKVNGDSSANRYNWWSTFSVLPNQTLGDSNWQFAYQVDNGTANSLIEITIPDYANASTAKIMYCMGYSVDSSDATQVNSAAYVNYYNQTTAITSLDIFPSAGNWTSGTVLLYGVK